MRTHTKTHIRTIDLEPRTISEVIHGTTVTATVRAKLTISDFYGGLYLDGSTWRNGQLVECYGVGGEVADSIVKRHTGLSIKDAANA